MNMRRHNHDRRPAPAGSSDPRSGSVLVVVLWIVFGLITITLYFASSMVYELRASDNRAASSESEQVIEAARRYVTCVLSNLNEPGVIPDPQAYLHEDVQVGNGRFWLIGRTNTENQALNSGVTFGLIDEASKINLNSSLANTNLALLPRMTIELAYNIMNWTNTSGTAIVGGADTSAYVMLQPAYLCKAAPFETVDELRLVYNMNLDLLYGEDANLNGIVDPNENDGDALPPSDNMDGLLNPGLLEYLTVYSHCATNQTNGSAKVNVTTIGTTGLNSLTTNLTTFLGDARTTQILTSLRTSGYIAGGGGGFGGGGTVIPLTSPLQFYMVSGMTPAEFAKVEGLLIGNNSVGLINVNTASAAVLACLPGMDASKASQVVTYRQSNQGNQDTRNSVSWIAQVLDTQTAIQIGPWVTGRTYQFTADVAAVGHDGRGFRRVRFVFDTSQGAPVVVYRQDLTHLGWPLGKTVRANLLTAK